MLHVQIQVARACGCGHRFTAAVLVGGLGQAASAATVTYYDAYRYAQVKTVGGTGTSETFVDARYYSEALATHGVSFYNATSGSSLVKVTIYLKECSTSSSSSCTTMRSQAYEEYVLASQLKKFTTRGVTMQTGKYYLSCSSVESSDGFKIVNQCAHLMLF